MWLSSVYFVNLMRPNMKQSRKGRKKIVENTIGYNISLGISTLTAWCVLAWVFLDRKGFIYIRFEVVFLFLIMHIF